MMLEGGTMGSTIMRFTFTVSADGSRLVKSVRWLCFTRSTSMHLDHWTNYLFPRVRVFHHVFRPSNICCKKEWYFMSRVQMQGIDQLRPGLGLQVEQAPALHEYDSSTLALSEASVFTQYYCSKWSKILLYSRVVKATEYSRIVISHGTIFYLVPNTFLGLLSNDTENGSGSGAGSWGQKAVSKNETGWCMKRTENEAAWSSKKPEKETERVWSPVLGVKRVKLRSRPLQPQAEIAKDAAARQPGGMYNQPPFPTASANMLHSSNHMLNQSPINASHLAAGPGGHQMHQHPYPPYNDQSSRAFKGLVFEPEIMQIMNMSLMEAKEMVLFGRKSDFLVDDGDFQDIHGVGYEDDFVITPLVFDEAIEYLKTHKMQVQSLMELMILDNALESAPYLCFPHDT
ncbi:hypothetical protein Tco_0870965 [Tanacetum coccineum]